MASTDFDNWCEQYEHRAEAIVQQHDADIRALFAQSGLLNEAPPERIEVETLRAEAAVFDQEVTQMATQSVPVAKPVLAKDWAAALHDCDALLTAAFTPGGRKLFQSPTPHLRRFDSTEKWRQVVEQALSLSAAEREAWRRQALFPGVLHVPGAGTLVDVERLSQQADLHPDDPTHYYAITLRTLAAERWGRRLITDESLLGQELAQSGIWTRELRRGLMIDLAPQVQDSAQMVLDTSSLVRLGWPRWVSKYMLDYANIEEAMLAPARSGPNSLVDVMDDLGAAIRETLSNEGQAIMAWVLFVLKALLLVRGTQSTLSQRAMWAYRRLQPGLDAAFGKIAKTSFTERLADVLFSRLDAAVGPDNMPYAVMIACGLKYDVAHTSAEEMKQRIETDPELDVDLRLVLLGGLKNMRHRPVRDIARAARHDLGITVPDELFEIH